MTNVLDIRNLNVNFAVRDGDVHAVNDVSLSVAKGQCLGIVGESGSGKSQTFMAAMGLLAANGRATGAVNFHGQNLLGLSERAHNTVRGSRMTMVFQDPMTSLTPHMRIGRQLTEVLQQHKGFDTTAARSIAIAMLARVHIPEPERRMNMYPHELSGGLRQRVMIAMALLCEPELLIADEPTTALDVTVQAQILDVIREMKDTLHTAVVLITHDLGVIAGLADHVAVMYAGRVVETADVRTLFKAPKHPYTQSLLACTPRLDELTQTSLLTIPGQPPNLERLPSGCAFHPRCPSVMARCRTERPALIAGKACFLEPLRAAS